MILPHFEIVSLELTHSGLLSILCGMFVSLSSRVRSYMHGIIVFVGPAVHPFHYLVCRANGVFFLSVAFYHIVLSFCASIGGA